MKLNFKRIIIPALAVVTALSMSVPAYADDREKISTIKLKVDCGEEPEAGDDVGSVDVTISSGANPLLLSSAPMLISSKIS